MRLSKQEIGLQNFVYLPLQNYAMRVVADQQHERRPLPFPRNPEIRPYYETPNAASSCPIK